MFSIVISVMKMLLSVVLSSFSLALVGVSFGLGPFICRDMCRILTKFGVGSWRIYFAVGIPYFIMIDLNVV